MQIRGLLYVGMARGGPDARAFEAIRRMRQDYPTASELTLADFKAMVRDQYFMLLIDREAAIAAIPALLPPDADLRRKAFTAIEKVLSAAGEVTGEAAARLARIAQLFEADTGRLLPKVIAPPAVSSIDIAKDQEAHGCSPAKLATGGSMSEPTQIRSSSDRPHAKYDYLIARASRSPPPRPSWFIPATRHRCAERPRRPK